LAGQNLLRISAVALALCTLSFAAGVAGDLAEPPTSGVRVVLRIPPELPQDSVRAGPIAQVLQTPVAAAATPRRAPRQLRAETPLAKDVIEPLEKPQRAAPARSEPKRDPDRAPKYRAT